MEPCLNCGFELWSPIEQLSVSDLSLYSDSRFPGRSILSLRDHWESLEELPEELLQDFLRDVRRSIAALKLATGSERINFAVLGNTVPHVHAHLIPRYPEQELKPGSSPWDDPRPREKLSEAREDELIVTIRYALGVR